MISYELHFHHPLSISKCYVAPDKSVPDLPSELPLQLFGHTDLIENSDQHHLYSNTFMYWGENF